MIMVAWAFPKERIGEFEQLFKRISADLKDVNHFFVTSPEELTALSPQVLVTNQYDWSLKYCAESRDLKWVHFMSAGIDKAIEIIKAGNNSEIIITNVKGIHADCISNYVMSWILAEAQNLSTYIKNQSIKFWDRKRSFSLNGKKMLVYGYGHVGRPVGELGLKFGMKVVGVKNRDKLSPENSDETIITLEKIKSHAYDCDYVIICAPLTEQTRSAFNTSLFNTFTNSPMLINVSRAEIIDQSALKIALDKNKIRFAVLDAHEQEPLPADASVWEESKVQVTPHIAGYAEGGIEKGVSKFAEYLKYYLDGQIPEREKVSLKAGY